MRNIESGTPTRSFVKGFTGKGCGVPLRIGNLWIQMVPESFSVISLEISDPENPRDVSSIISIRKRAHWRSTSAFAM